MPDNSGINTEGKFVDQVRSNTKSDLIEITEDKLENILLKYLERISKVRSWLTPFSLFITILIVILTANFTEFIGIKKEVWKAIFIISLLVTAIWTGIASIQSIKHSKNSSISFLISEIKNHF